VNYIFTMIGEFGYEVLNWHGVVRKWALYNKKEGDTITICSRNGLELFYDFADNFVNLSQFDSFNKTITDCYEAYIVPNGDVETLPRKEWVIQRHGKHIQDIKDDVTLYINNMISGEKRFIWSFEFEEIDGFHFGKQQLVYGGIYDPNLIAKGEFGAPLRIEENLYNQIKLDSFMDETKEKIQEKVDIDLDEPFIFTQTAFRTGYDLRSTVEIDHENLFKGLKDKYPILFLDFKSGRKLDSFSNFDGYQTYSTNNLKEQLVLMSLSKYNILTSEGDYRSHFYLPCFVGKDSHVIAANDIMNRLSATSCDFYNEYVFTFGGHIKNYVYEDVINNLDKFYEVFE